MVVVIVIWFLLVVVVFMCCDIEAMVMTLDIAVALDVAF